ncbi:MAG: glucuronate isomerase [Cyclobacteriaceae bacterium]|nr:glucuronate isomerase [Cyclobacteriaceae bacterium]
MKKFLGEKFLLTNKVAEYLYFNHAQKMPIIDYHNHLIPQQIAENKQFENITEAWLDGDHYKWRAMRANGINEKYITGNATAKDKFLKWGKTAPHTLRNPLYHWSHLELQRYFGINELLNHKTASNIYDATSEKLQAAEFSCQGLLSQMNVKLLCTTDDPVDNLAYHQQIAVSGFNIKVLPTFRPDKALGADNPTAYNNYLNTLEKSSNIAINSLNDLLEALQQRINFFDANGCRISDLGFNTIPLLSDDNSNISSTFEKVRAGKTLTHTETEQLQAYILLELCKMYHAKGWAQQFHLGALRNNNDRGLRELGPDTGYDSIGDFNHAIPLSKFLNTLDNTNQLAKTILYNLNPRDNDLFATMAGNFNDGNTIGKIQFGTGWWFMDQKMGMKNQINSLSSMGLLSRFIGMLTDSRSFLSFPRHEYFRRILCNLLGTDVVNGELPNDMELLGTMVENICYTNAKNYFGFDLD